MKFTGIVRQVDPLGGIVIPVEIRKTHGVKPQAAFLAFTPLLGARP